MKKLLLFIIVIGFLTTTISTAAQNYSKSGFYNNYRPIEFEEDGILFLVFPDGEFEFEILYNKQIEVGFRFKNGQVRLGKNTPIRIEQDRYGNIYRIENVFIDYNRSGKVSRIGSVDIYYQRGLIRTIGFMNLVYHPKRNVEYIGYVKYKNHPKYDRYNRYNRYDKSEDHRYDKHPKKNYSYNDGKKERENVTQKEPKRTDEIVYKRRPYNN